MCSSCSLAAAVAVSPISQGCLQLISLDLLHFVCQLRGFSLYARSLEMHERSGNMHLLIQQRLPACPYMPLLGYGGLTQGHMIQINSEFF